MAQTAYAYVLSILVDRIMNAGIEGVDETKREPTVEP